MVKQMPAHSVFRNSTRASGSPRQTVDAGDFAPPRIPLIP